MAHQEETFFTSAGCMDGRVQKVIAGFGREKFGAEYPDTVTEAGLVGLLAKQDIDQELLKSLLFKIRDVSLNMHHSKGIIVHGHAECAGNPVSDERQKDDIRRSVAVISSFVTSVPVIGVFAHRNASHHWVAEEVV